MTPEQLDDLFRANDARADFRPQPGEWEQMDALLEEDERRGGAAQWVSAAWLLLFVGLIVGGIAGAVRFAPGSGDRALTKRPTTGAHAPETVTPIRSIGTESQRLSPKPVTASSVTPSPASATVGAAGNLAVHPRPLLPAPRVLASGLSPKPASEYPQETNPEAEPTSLTLRRTRTTSTPTDSAGAKTAGAKTAGAKSSTLKLADSELAASTPEAFSKPSPLRPLDQTALSPVHSVRPSDRLEGLLVFDPTLSEGRLMCLPGQKRLAFSALLAAEANEVELDGPLAFGGLFGLGADVRVAPRWTLGAAVLIGTRNYTADRDEINMPRAFFVDEVMPMQTRVNASVLEFPITLTYTTPFAGRALSWFAQAGINSFKFLSDDMSFTYAEARSGQLTAMRDDDPGGAFASSIRLGGGVGFKPTGLPPLRVNPYVQLPLQRTGYSEVSLYTLGLQLQVGF